MENKLSFIDITALLMATVMWALSFPFIKIGLEYYPPIMLGAIRYFLGALPLIVILIIKRNENVKVSIIFKHNWKYIFAVGIFMVTIPNIAQNIGMLYTTASLSTLIQSVGPVFAVTLAILFLKESATIKKLFGTVLALSCSILLVFTQGVEIGGNNLILFGNILQFITAISYGINSLFSKIAVGKISPITIVGWGMLVGTIPLFPISLMTESQTWVNNIDLYAVWVMGFLALFPCMFATLLWYTVLQKNEVSKQVLFIYLIPFFAIFASYLLLGEVIGIMVIILGILTIIGVAIAQQK